MKRWSLVVLVVLLAVAGTIPTVQAQNATPPATVGPDQLAIEWPVPVSEVFGTGNITGTVNIPNLNYYVIEFLPLNEDLTMPANAPWIPAIGAQNKPVQHGILATIDTTIAPDGLYALRLTAYNAAGQSFHFTVTPLRVSNERFAALLQQLQGTATVTAVPTRIGTPFADTTPRVTATRAATIRYCDIADNARCPAVGWLRAGESALIIGTSAANTGWYQIQTAAGITGWIAPSIVTVSGDVSRVPQATAPAPYVGQTTPGAAGQIVVNGIVLNPTKPVCGQAFTVQVNVTNTATANAAPGLLTVQDVAVRTGDITAVSTGNYPALAPNQNFVVNVPLVTTAFYNEIHQVRVFSSSSQIVLNYALAQGTCGTPITPTAVTASPAPPTATLTALPPTQAVPPAQSPTAAAPTAQTATTRAATRAATP